MRLKYGSIKNPVVAYFSMNREGVVAVEEKGRDYLRTIRTDEGGDYFTWNKKKYYINDFIKVPMSELKAHIEAGKFVTEDDFYQSVKTDGVENVRFEVPFSVRGTRAFGIELIDTDKTLNVPCKIQESFNRELESGYKLDFVPLKNQEDVSSKVTFYMIDFISSLRSGYVKILPTEA